MSLKAFHIVFIFAATLMMVALEMWELKNYLLTQDATSLVMAAVAFVGTVVLVGYAMWAVRKLKDIGPR